MIHIKPYFLCIFFLFVTNSFSQVIIQDTLDLDRTEPYFDYPLLSSATSTYTVRVTVHGYAVQPGYDKIEAMIGGTVYTLVECTTPTPCYPSSNGYSIEKQSNSPEAFIYYYDGANTPSVRMKKVQDPLNLHFFEVYFKFPGANEILAGEIKINVIINPNSLTPTFIRYSQSDVWGADHYDNAPIDPNTGVPYTISQWGCAVTCMAMAFKAYGVNIDPRGLNDAMIANDGYKEGSAVNWRFKITGNENLFYDERYSSVDQMERFNNGRIDMINSYRHDLANIDTYLANGFPVIAKVANPKKDDNDIPYFSPHYVLIYKKDNATGAYLIFDPGYGSRTTLASYNGNIYQYHVYRP